MSIIRSGLLLLLGLALAAIWFASAAANFADGVQRAGHSSWWLVLGLASASLDCAKAWALISLTEAWKQRRYTSMVACVLVWIVTTGWGVSACMGFISTLMSDTVAERSMHTVADLSLKKQVDDQGAQITKLQDHKLKAPARDWERIEGEIVRTEARLEKLQKRVRTTQTVGDPDALATALKRVFDLDPETFRFGKTVLFLLGIEICASLGFIAFMPLFGAKPVEEVQKLAGAMAAPALTPSLPPQGGGPLPASGRGTSPAASRGSPLRAQTKALIGQLEARYGEGMPILSTTVFAAYQALAAERSWMPRMTSLKLGQQLALLGVTKLEPDEHKRVFYVLPTARERNDKWEEERRPPAA